MTRVSAITLITSIMALTAVRSPAQAAPEPPSAVVTFYSSSALSNILKSALPGYKHGPFRGGIFDGDHLLAQIIPTYFVTFTLPAGPHDFSASVSGYRPAKDALLQINLEANRQYFFRLDQELIVPPVVVPVSTYKGVIEQIPCVDAARENAKSKPLKPRHILPDALPLAVADPTFPHCP